MRKVFKASPRTRNQYHNYVLFGERNKSPCLKCYKLDGYRNYMIHMNESNIYLTEGPPSLNGVQFLKALTFEVRDIIQPHTT